MEAGGFGESERGGCFTPDQKRSIFVGILCVMMSDMNNNLDLVTKTGPF